MKIDKGKAHLQMAKICISQKNLAEKAGIPKQTLSLVLNGRNCRPEILGKIAKALRVEPEQIIE